jgi:hypothetical protein
MSRGSSGTTTATTNTSPWAGQQPYLSYGFEEAQKRYQDTQPEYYPGSTVVPFAPQTEQALGAQEARATAGSPLLRAAQGQSEATLRGDYLNQSNPYLQQIFQQTADEMRPRIDAQFEGAGRYGSGAHANATASALANLRGNLGYADYQRERQNQLGQIGGAPRLAAADYDDFTQLGQVGAAREGKAGSELQDMISRWNFGENIGSEELQRFMAMISGGNFGGTSTTQQPYYTNPYASALSGATGIAGALGNLGLKLFRHGGYVKPAREYRNGGYVSRRSYADGGSVSALTDEERKMARERALYELKLEGTDNDPAAVKARTRFLEELKGSAKEREAQHGVAPGTAFSPRARKYQYGGRVGAVTPEEREQSIYDGLLGLSAALGEAGGPSPYPRGLLDAFGKGAQGFAGGAQQSRERAMRKRLYDMQLAKLMRGERQEVDQDAAKAALFGGTDPKTGIDWKTGRRAPGSAGIDLGPDAMTQASPIGEPGGVGLRPEVARGLLGAQSAFARGTEELFAQGFPDEYGKAAVERLFPKPPDPFTLGEGQVRYSPSGRQIAQVPPKAEKPIFQDKPGPDGTIQKVVSYDGGETFQPFGESYDRREPFIIQEIIGEDGTKRQVAIPRTAFGKTPAAPSSAPTTGQAGAPGLPPGSRVLGETPHKLTDEQAKARGFYERMTNSHNVVSDLETSGTSLRGRALAGVPMVGNYAQTEEFQKFSQAERDFINAVLRRESGATITDPEFANARQQYFPQPGDGKDVIAQKRKNRETAIQAMRHATGPGYKPTEPKRMRFDAQGNLIP